MAQRFTYHTPSTRSMYHIVTIDSLGMFMVRAKSKKTAMEIVRLNKLNHDIVSIDVTYQDKLGRVYKILDWNRPVERPQTNDYTSITGWSE